MYAAKRLHSRSIIFVIILASFVLVACGATGVNTNWPGLSTDGKNVYVAYGPGVLAYDVTTQANIWSFPAEANRSLSFYAAPSVQDGRIVFGDYGASGGFFSPKKVVTVYALNVAGEGAPDKLWDNSEIATDSVVAPPLQVGDRVFVGTADKLVYALDATTGKMLWPEPFETGHSIWGKPAHKDGLLFVNSLDKTVYAIEVENGKEVWRKAMDGALASAPVVNMDLLYVVGFDKHLHALDIDTGQERWIVEAEDWIWGAPIYDDGVVYFVDAKGNVYAVDAQTGEQLWGHQIEKPVQTSPVLNDGIVYIGSEGNEETEQGLLTALSAEDGVQLWQVNTLAPLYTTPVVVDDLIVVAMLSESALLSAFDLATGSQQWVIPPPSQ